MFQLKAAVGRTLQLGLVLWAVVTILFLMFRLMPGNPMAAYIDPTFTEEQQLALMAQFGLDKPLWEQYFIYLANLVQGELGQSFRYREPVAERILALLPNTLILTFTSLIIAYVFGVLAGAYLAWRRGSAVEQAAIPVVLTTRAMPGWFSSVDRSMLMNTVVRPLAMSSVLKVFPDTMAA
jgi:peptide/nickel transport system permease protein